MAFSEFELRRLEKLVGQYVEKRRPPPHIRPELDIAYRISGQSVEVFEVRPVWKQPDEIGEHPVAKATYVKTQGIWKVYWMRADLKWHGYQPHPQVKHIEEFLALVDHDQYGCFWG